MSATLSITGGERRVFTARLAALPATATFIDAFCARCGFGSADALRLTLIVEELFSYSVVHGYGGDCDAPIEVALAGDGGEITLLYEDAAPPYDPLSAFAQAPDHLHGSVESRPTGGLGIHLVRELAESARYAREAGRNRLWLRMVCQR
jgi:anti-sigma regulatory factor (Ser/Thr protein kinase)